LEKRLKVLGKLVGFDTGDAIHACHKEKCEIATIRLVVLVQAVTALTTLFT
jgi:hypothetical protein